ncbi:MAG: hypothetical protein IIB31_02395 [Chloroflexi bacterium]|nr:hypothetical protein [Chloroflexota bacterium]
MTRYRAIEPSTISNRTGLDTGSGDGVAAGVAATAGGRVELVGATTDVAVGERGLLVGGTTDIAVGGTSVFEKVAVGSDPGNVAG